MRSTLLNWVGSVHRKVLVTHRLRAVAWHAVLVLLSIGALVMLDWFVRWPWPMRVLILAALLVAWIRVVRSLVVHLWVQAPTMQAVALRLERLEPGLSGTLTSSMEFLASGAGPGQRMADRVIEATTSAWQRLQPGRHVRWSGALLATAAAVVTMIGAVWLAQRQPEMVGVGLRRTLTPWTLDQWPSRVQIAMGKLPDLLARGASLDLQARLVRGETEGMRVQAICTTEDTSGRRTERRIDLTRQADGSHARTIPAEGERFTIQLAAGDAQTEPHEIRIVTAPQVVEGSLVVEPPRHAQGLMKPLQASWKGHDAGDYSGILEGSAITVDLTLAAPAPQSVAQEGQPPIVSMKGQPPQSEPRITVKDPTHWRLQWTAFVSSELLVQPEGTEGVRAADPLRITINTMPDRPPTVSVTDPSTDEIVTPLAQMPFTVEARDDLQLLEAGWRVDRQQRSGEPEPVRLKQAARSTEGTETRIQASLDLPSLEVRSGDTLLLRGTALDGMEAGGTPRGVTMSEARRIRVVDAPTFERQVRQQAESLRQVVARLEQAQEELIREPDVEAGTRGQNALGERIRQAQAAAGQLADRMARNGLQEQALAEALREALDAAAQASQASNTASEALRNVAQGGADAQRKAGEAQAGSREELRRMGEALERDDRTAGAQRRAERIASQIEQLRKDLQQASRGGEGVVPDELPPERRRALQEQAERQRAMAEEIRSMLEDLRGSAAAARASDKAQSRALQQAAEEGERAQAARRMDEAGDRTDRNQSTAADQSMQAAAEAMDRVQQALREDRRARTEDLRRRMASLVEALQSLAIESDRIAGQIDVWIGDRSQPTDPVASALMLVTRNTGSAAEEAADGGNTLRKAAGLVLRAMERQQAALEAMRRSPVAAEESRDAVTRSAELLREAVAEVRKAQQQETRRQADRERRELAKIYAEMAAAMLQIREAAAATIPPDGGRLDRRGAATQREQGALLGDLQRRFEQGPMASPLVAEAQVFKTIHQRVQQGMADAGQALREALAQGGTVRTLDGAVAGLQALAQALREPEPGEDPFGDAKSGGSSGAGGQAGPPGESLPPVAELRLVREMQAHVNQLTRDLGKAREAGQSVDEPMREVGRLQDEVRRLGEDWIERMKRREEGDGTGRSDSTQEEPPEVPTPSLGWRQDPPKPPESQDAVQTPAPPKPPTAPPSSLDDLLGIPDDPGTTEAADRGRQDRLEKSLRREDLDDLAKSATESMRVASTMLVEKADGGLGTQRAQTRALADLDALLDAATQFQKQQGSKSSSSSSGKRQSASGRNQRGEPSDSPSKPAPTGGTPEASRAQGQPDGSRAEASPPTDAVVATEGTLEEGRSEWGNLPPRIREILSQSRRDRVSALYQQATEAYYRRLAEERQP